MIKGVASQVKSRTYLSKLSYCLKKLLPKQKYPVNGEMVSLGPKSLL
jgi:hypothetical protein